MSFQRGLFGNRIRFSATWVAAFETVSVACTDAAELRSDAAKGVDMRLMSIFNYQTTDVTKNTILCYNYYR
jgi:hypothetical protein